MPAQQPEFALKVMHSELTDFVRLLQRHKILDGANTAYSIGDLLKDVTSDGQSVNWGYNSGKLALRLAPASVVHPAQTKSLGCNLEVTVDGEISVGKIRDEFEWKILKTEVNLEFYAESRTVHGGWSQFWHLDTHIDGTRAGSAPPE